MKAIRSTLTALAFFATGCGATKQTDSTLASASARQAEGTTKIRVVEKHDYVSLQLKGDDLFAVIWNLLDAEPVIEGEDAAYVVSKQGADFGCSASTEAGDLDPANFEDPSCEIRFSRDGKAGVQSDDPWSWADAPIKSGEIFTTATFKNGRLWIDVNPSSDTYILWDQLTGIAAENDLDEEVQHKRGEDIHVEYQYADGDDFVGSFQINKRGELTAE